MESIEKIKNQLKKKTKTYKEQDPVKVKEYLDIIDKIPSDRIIYVDETGIEQYLYREYGRSYIGQKIHDKVSGKKYHRIGIVPAKQEKRFYRLYNMKVAWIVNFLKNGLSLDFFRFLISLLLL